MFERIKGFVKRVVSRMFDTSKIENELDVDIAVSKEMAEGITLWLKMFADDASWLDDNTKSMGLAADIASEVARLTTLELESEVSGCDYLNEEYQEVLRHLRENCEFGCAGGGLILKPYVDGNCIAVEASKADSFFPIAFNGRKQITDCVFAETKIDGEKTYTRLERHTLEDQTYHITNKAYVSTTKDAADIKTLGEEIELRAVDEWADLEPELEISNIEQCLFGYFKVPLANTTDPDSPLGVSVYSRAVKNIQEADKQWSRILWEFEGGELAVHASVDCFNKDDFDEWILPKGKERLYRTFDHDSARGKAIEVFSPAFRDTSLFNGLNNILKRVEFDCGLAYGTLSDPQNVDKTAEEIKSSKQRSWQMISDTQKALQTALEELLYAMVKIGQIYDLPVTDNYEVSFNWDDSIIVDKKEELASMQVDVASGIIRPELYIMEKYGVTEDEALKMMPKRRELTEDPDDME